MEEQLQQQRLGGAAAMKPTCPPWLQAAIADIEQRVRSVSLSTSESETTEQSSFGERAANYYEKRPQLLALLTDLHRRYLYLADRYSLLSIANKAANNSDFSCLCSSSSGDADSDAGSSLSFQFQHPPTIHPDDDPSPLVVAELVAAWVDRDILADEAERRRAEAARRIELQGCLVEVLESERLVLLGENARLGLRSSAAEDELGYVRRRAAEMARLVVKLREDHRVCLMGRRVEALQAQVYGLELRNRECCDAMATWDVERKVGAAEIERLRSENRKLQMQGNSRRKKKKNGGSGWWWSRVRQAAELGPCAPPSAVTMKGGGCFFCG